MPTTEQKQRRIRAVLLVLTIAVAVWAGDVYLAVVQS